MTTHIRIQESPRLEISKTVEQMDFVSRSYGLGIWPTPEVKSIWKHDLGLMRECLDLKQVRLELIGADRSIVFQLQMNFGLSRQFPRRDSARGVELPLIERSTIAAHRVLVDRLDKESHYRHLLKMNWSPAEKLPRRQGTAFDSDHASKISGGRLRGRYHVDQSARHRLRITQSGGRGFAFADSLDNPQIQGVFCLQDHAPADVAFVLGAVMTALLVQTPRGIQARSIQST